MPSIHLYYHKHLGGPAGEGGERDAEAWQLPGHAVRADERDLVPQPGAPTLLPRHLWTPSARGKFS